MRMDEEPHYATVRCPLCLAPYVIRCRRNDNGERFLPEMVRCLCGARIRLTWGTSNPWQASGELDESCREEIRLLAAYLIPPSGAANQTQPKTPEQ
jgi:hypothetical protein